MRYISGSKLDDRNIRVDLDVGFTKDRQYGRGRTGRQVCILLVTLLFFILINIFFYITLGER